jgi:SAM-dependent methyltransferase
MPSEHKSSVNATAFGEYAADYAKSRPQYPAALWQWLASQCQSHEHAWDAGCGNGQASLALAQYFNHVTATDISAEQITSATPHKNVSYAAIRTEDASFASASLDLVCVAQALHWFDLAKFWPQVQSALKPRGVFLAVAYGLFSVNDEIDAISKKYFYDVVDPYQAAGNRMVANGYCDIQFPFEMIEAPMMAIQCEWTLDQLVSYAATWSAVARMKKEQGVDPMAAYCVALEHIWGDVESQRNVRMPLTIRAGRLRAS